MDNVVITTSTDYKLKNVYFSGKNLVNEDGEIIDLMDNLNTIFGDECFDISVTNKNKVNYTVDYFKEDIEE